MHPDDMRIDVRLKSWLRDKLAALAAKEGVPLNDMAVRAIEVMCECEPGAGLPTLQRVGRKPAKSKNQRGK
jgi:hypothetical protein